MDLKSATMTVLAALVALRDVQKVLSLEAVGTGPDGHSVRSERRCTTAAALIVPAPTEMPTVRSLSP
jgi:hypothetical protein